jgi:hypothetical protein
MWRRQCIASQFAAEYAWAASSSSMSSNGLGFLRVPGMCGSIGGEASGLGADVAGASVIDPPNIRTVR